MASELTIACSRPFGVHLDLPHAHARQIRFPMLPACAPIPNLIRSLQRLVNQDQSGRRDFRPRKATICCGVAPQQRLEGEGIGGPPGPSRDETPRECLVHDVIGGRLLVPLLVPESRCRLEAAFLYSGRARHGHIDALPARVACMSSVTIASGVVWSLTDAMADRLFRPATSNNTSRRRSDTRHTAHIHSAPGLSHRRG